MQNILEEFWYGNICPGEECRRLNKETKELMGYIAKHQEDLCATLTEKQKALFEKFNDCYSEMTEIYERELFIYAFRLGAKMAIEVMEFKAE